MQIDLRSDELNHPYAGHAYPIGEEVISPSIEVGEHRILLTEDQMETLAKSLMDTLDRPRRSRVIDHFLR